MKTRYYSNELHYEFNKFIKLTERWLLSLLRLHIKSFKELTKFLKLFLKLFFKEPRITFTHEPGKTEPFELRRLEYEKMLGPPRM